MHLSKRVKVVAGVSALLGVVMAGGAAFTATGITDNAYANQFLGGTVTQNVYGISLASVVYGLASGGTGSEGSSNNDNEVNLITLTFAGSAADLTFANAQALVPTLSLTLDSGGPDSVTCTGIGVVDAGTPLVNVATPDVAYCDISDVVGINEISVTLANDQVS
jgi:hypothetical protein